MEICENHLFARFSLISYAGLRLFHAPSISVSLTSSLPFADDTFDFVHARSIGMAVPEDKVQFYPSRFAKAC